MAGGSEDFDHSDGSVGLRRPGTGEGLPDDQRTVPIKILEGADLVTTGGKFGEPDLEFLVAGPDREWFDVDEVEQTLVGPVTEKEDRDPMV